jgi:hypothetical protein
VGIVALAHKLLIALWRYVAQGELHLQQPTVHQGRAPLMNSHLPWQYDTIAFSDLLPDVFVSWHDIRQHTGHKGIARLIDCFQR